MRILFMGTPDIAAECLKALYAAGHEICAVYTRRDKPVGRKQVLTAPPVKEVALAHGTPVFQPRTLRDGSEDENIRALAPELIVVVAYGCILPASVLAIPKYGCINLHVSLLPKYRGASPVTAALLAGDELTGVSVIRMGRGMDDGPVLRTAVEPIYSDDTGDTLMERLAIAGGVTLAKTLKLIEADALPPPVEQEDARATFAHKIKKTDGLIHWNAKSREIERLLRAYASGMISLPEGMMEMEAAADPDTMEGADDEE